MIIIGIDPGLKGGIVCHRDGQLTHAYRLPVLANEVNPHLVYDLIEYDADAIVAIEVQQARPQQGRSSILKTGKSWGQLIGFAEGRGHRVIHVRSQEWKPTFRLTGKDKEASRAKAIELWPHFIGSFKYKRDDGVAEAALIAEHVYRQHHQTKETP